MLEEKSKTCQHIFPENICSNQKENIYFIEK